MKEKLFLLWYVTAALFAGCSDEENATIDLLPSATNSEVSTSLNLAETSGAGANVLFESSHDWEAKVTLSDGSECDWLQLSPASGQAGKNTVKVITKTDNLTGDVRKALLTLYGDGNGYQLTVLEGAGTYIQNLWRPTEDSMMNSSTSGFNVISREAIYKRVMQLAYGSPWEYDYEEFVKFDLAHLPVNSKSIRIPLRDDESFRIIDQGTVQKLPRFHRSVFVNQRID